MNNTLTKHVFIITFISTMTSLAIDYDNYSINFFYNNKKLNRGSEYLFVDDKTEEYLLNIVHWAQENPKAIIRLWFDNMDSTGTSVANTRKELVKRLGDRRHQLEMMDMRMLDGVARNPLIFSLVFTYLRFDFVRVFTAEEMIRRGGIFVFANLNLAAIPEIDLFDGNTRLLLNRFGLVMSQLNSCYENNFFIRADSNANMTAAIKEWAIDVNLARLDYFFDYCRSKQGSLPLHLSQELVYQAYPIVFQKFFDLERMATLTKLDVLETEAYPLFGSAPKRFYKFKRRPFTFLPTSDYQNFVKGELAAKRGVEHFSSYLATKPVVTPSITGVYEEIESDDAALIDLLSKS